LRTQQKSQPTLQIAALDNSTQNSIQLLQRPLLLILPNCLSIVINMAI